MWKSLDLHNLGVSLNDRGSKVVLTTRSREVCTRMGDKNPIKVVPLSEEEGWRLFSSRAFCDGNVPQGIEDNIARKIAGECKGLPLAIKVVAATMAGKDYPRQWEDALRQMQTVDKTFYWLHNEMDEEVFQHLKWSYDVLPDYLKTCFVYFAAYPEDAEIYCEDVIDIWIAEGLVPKSSGDHSYLPDTAHSFIDFLRDGCLIEVVQTDEVGRVKSVKIHDVIRDLAILIAQKVHKCYFKAGQGVSHFPSETDSDGCARMSLMSNALHTLPTTFRCLSLSVLLLRGNEVIQEVPGSFLDGLPSLRVLDLSGTGIRSLPPSIGNLKHLSSLQLQGCRGITELPESIGDLKELQFLNVFRCGLLRCLPERIRELKRLRALDIRGCYSLEHFHRGISELGSLERLRATECGIAWDLEEEAKGLQSLSSLRLLQVRIKSAVKEGVTGNWSKMRHLLLEFEYSVGQDYQLPQDMQAMEHLESLIIQNCDVERLPGWVTQFRKLAYLYLGGCAELKELPAELPGLTKLWIFGCSKLEALELGMGFPKLQELNLWYLESLECLGAVGRASGSAGLGEGASPLLPMLKSLNVRYCPKLKRLRGGWDNLKCLEQIHGSSEWWDAIEWDNPTMKTSLGSKFIRF